MLSVVQFLSFLHREGAAWHAGEYRCDKDSEGGVGDDGGSRETGERGSAAVAQNGGDHRHLQESGHHVEHHAAQNEIDACSHSATNHAAGQFLGGNAHGYCHTSFFTALTYST